MRFIERRKNILCLLLVLISILSGYLFSKVSWFGSMGIRWIYKEYAFLKTWWQAALVELTIFTALYVLLYFITKNARYRKITSVVLILIACLGIYLTYLDFRETLTHRWLGERFHLGAYCFWMGWIAIGLYYAINKSTTSDNREIIN